MKNVKSILPWIIVVIVLVIVGYLLVFGKLAGGKQNSYSTDCGFFDEDRRYISEISMEFDLQTDETYRENISVTNDKMHSLSISMNDLSKDAEIRLKDKDSNIILNEKIRSGKNQSLLSNREISGGDYILEISLDAGTKGVLEIKVDEE